MPDQLPSTTSTKFKNALEEQDLDCHIWSKREIEYYYPEEILIEAQQGDEEKEEAVVKILNGDQSEKFRDAAKPHEICVPKGNYLRRLLNDHLTEKGQLDQEIRDIVEQTLIEWKREIL